MAFTFNGIGTKFYGERDLRSDHSYITTEWITIFYVPIVPIRSFRVRETAPPADHKPIPIGLSVGTEHYMRGRSTLPDWRQTLCTYGFMALCAAWGTAIISAATAGYNYLSAHSHPDAAVVFGILCPILTGWPPVLLPRYLRNRAALRLYSKPHAQ